MVVMVKKSLLTVLPVLLGGWMLLFGWQHYQAAKNPAALGGNELHAFPQVAFEKGMTAYRLGDHATAKAHFSQAVNNDPVYMDAWLRLAETEIVIGNAIQAEKILQYTHRHASGTLRWRWHQMLLARDLGLEALFVEDANLLLAWPPKRADTFQFMESDTGFDSQKMLGLLLPAHYDVYLKWLMRWRRTEDCLLVWDALAPEQRKLPEPALSLVDFLVGQKRPIRAWEIHQQIEGPQRPVNPGFERALGKRGFSWRTIDSKNDYWHIRRSGSHVFRGNAALEISFNGAENVSFGHVYQVIPVIGGQSYTLGWYSKGREISTDQGPFIEVSGYGCKGVNAKGGIRTGNWSWEPETVEFKVPSGCEAVLVKLRRNPSKRFDSLISGTIWLDDFSLEGS